MVEVLEDLTDVRILFAHEEFLSSAASAAVVIVRSGSRRPVQALGGQDLVEDELVGPAVTGLDGHRRLVHLRHYVPAETVTHKRASRERLGVEPLTSGVELLASERPLEP